MQKLGFALALILVGLMLVLAIQNLDDVSLRFLGWKWEISLAVPLISAYFLGTFTGRPTWRFINRQRKKRHDDKKAVSKADAAARKKARAEAKNMLRDDSSPASPASSPKSPS